jgi:hypothetical protein
MVLKTSAVEGGNVNAKRGQHRQILLTIVNFTADMYSHIRDHNLLNTEPLNKKKSNVLKKKNPHAINLNIILQLYLQILLIMVENQEKNLRSKLKL